jgi:hypothetical protein
MAKKLKKIYPKPGEVWYVKNDPAATKPTPLREIGAPTFKSVAEAEEYWVAWDAERKAKAANKKKKDI